MKRQQVIPGPSRLQLLFDYPKIRRDLVRYLAGLATKHGDTVLLPLRHPTYLLRDPADIKHVLVTNFKNYHKAGGLTVGHELLGDGLVSSEIPLHPRQRRIMQPAFHRQSIARFAGLMTGTTQERIRQWPDGGEINLSAEMLRITLAIVGQTLFSTDLSGSAQPLANAYLRCQIEITRTQRGFPLPRFFRMAANRRYQSALQVINQYIFQLIAARRSQSNPPDDLLSLLLASRYEDGSPMPDQLIRDEAVTILMAGHETMSNGLAWTLYLLCQSPPVIAKLQSELDQVLTGRLPTLADLPALRYTEMVFAESLRVFPPAWTLARRVLEPDTLPGGLSLQPGDEVIMSQFVCHRNGKYFSDPERFDPERFNPDTKTELPPFVYFPFGAGPRYCVGESFAKMEGVLLLATIMQQFDLELKPGQDIVPEPLITLRSKRPIWVRTRRR